MEVSVFEKEHIEYIDSRLRLIVSPEHTFGTDALLLAAFALPGKNEKACDLGTGCGIIPFYWISRGIKNIYGVEIQEQACSQTQRSIALSGVSNIFTLINSDLKDLDGKLTAGFFDTVTMNPPYTKAGHGIVSSARSDRTARHESDLNFSDIADCAARLLRFGGKFSICLRPERLPEVMCTMRESGIEPKRLRMVSQTDSKAPWLFLLEGKKGRNPGLIVEPELHIKNADGSNSAEMREILGEYGKD
jgi:tRNA1(Val) A37 N6-methylase TrmN6